MNVLVQLTKRNLLLNKKRAIGTIVGIMLSVALICAVSGMFTSFQETLIKNSIAGTGYYHIALSNISEADIEKLKLNKDISDINKLYEMGQSIYENIYLNVYAMDQEDFKNLSYKIIDGRYPSNEKEVVISQDLAEKTNLKIGDYIELEVGTLTIIEDTEEISIENGYQTKYLITGITYRRKYSTGDLVITTGTTSENIWAYLTLKDPKNYKDSFTELLGANHYQEVIDDVDLKYKYVINNELLRWEVLAFSNETMKMFATVAATVIGIIVVVSIFCIRNSFAISTTEKMKMFGMLASVGATKKQIKKTVLSESFFLALIGIPLGILLGILAVYFLVIIVNRLLGDFLLNNIDGLVFKISLLPIIVSILLGLITIYFSSISAAKKASRVSPIDNLRNSQEIKISKNKLNVPKFISSIFKTGGVLAYKSLKRSRQKYRTTVISLTTSIFVFVSMSYFVNIELEATKSYYKDYKYNILTFLNYDYKEEDIIKLKEVNNIKNSYVLYDFAYPAKVTDQNKINKYKDIDEDEEIYINIVGVDDAIFKEYTKRLKLNYDEVINQGILISDFDYWDNTQKKYVATDRYSYKTGEIANIEYVDESDNTNTLKIQLSCVTHERPIGLEDHYYLGGFLIINKDSFNNLPFYPTKLLIESEDNKDKEVTEALEEIDNTISVNNLTEEVKNEKAMIIVICIFLYGFITVVTLIGVTNIFNTLTSNMELRQKEFAVLKSVGMTNKEFNRMINLETLFYSTKSLVYGIGLGLIGSYLIYLGMFEDGEVMFKIPFLAIFISIIFVLAIVYIIMRYSIHKINRQNIIETIRKDNI